MATLEIDGGKLLRNVGRIEEFIPVESELIVVVKAGAYISDIKGVIEILSRTSIAKYAVATNEEAFELNRIDSAKPILILNPEINESLFSSSEVLEPCIFSIELLELIYNYSLRLEREVTIHLNLNSGMNRMGISDYEIEMVSFLLKGNRFLKLESVFSHFSSSDDPDLDDYSSSQVVLFNSMKLKLENCLGMSIKSHIQNTNGVFRFAKLNNDFVRIGIGLYGIVDPFFLTNNLILERVHKLSAKIIFIKEMFKGDSIGYGRSFICDTKLRVAVIPIGYADGISRRLAYQNFKVSVCDKEVRILGKISMDLISIDISSVDNAKIGSEVVFFSESKPIEDMSRALDTIPYEVLTNIGSRVKRKLINI